MGDTWSPWIKIKQPPRGGSSLPDWVNNCSPRVRQMSITHAWGSSPATGVVEYVISGVTASVPITTGARIEVGTNSGHYFVGVLKSDNSVISSRGHNRTLEFEDLRKVLDWDNVFASFNRPIKKIYNGTLQRWYEHILPENYLRGIKTYTTAPYTAAYVIQKIMAWYSEFSWKIVYHPMQTSVGYGALIGQYPTYPILNLEFNGVKLLAALNQIAEAHGLTFIHDPTLEYPFRLVFDMLGEGELPTFQSGTSIFPAGADNLRDGYVTSDNPTRVHVVGDRNLYQVNNVELEQDWNTNYNTIWSIDTIIDQLFEYGTMPSTVGTIPAATRYNNIPGDTEHAIGYQLAASRALTITVAEYAAWRSTTRGTLLFDNFYDYKKFNGQSRLNMPVAMYLSQIKFRAFRPQNNTVFLPDWSKGGQLAACPLGTLQICDQELVRCTHDIGSGHITATPNPTDGHGYVVVQGVNVGAIEAFKSLTPETFNLAAWQNEQTLWTNVPFQIDDNGESGFIILDSPVFRSDDFILSLEGVGGKQVPVFNATPTFKKVNVRASLVFAAERFLYSKTKSNMTIQNDGIETVSGLHYEGVIGSAGPNLPVTLNEIVHADGQSAIEKAGQIASALLDRPESFVQGGYTNYPKEGDTAIQVSNMYSRRTISYSESGFTEEIEFAGDRRSNAYMPIRDLDRTRNTQTLLPGQKELIEQSKQQMVAAMALRSNPKVYHDLAMLFSGMVGSGGRNTETERVTIASGSGTLEPFTPFWKKPVVKSGGININTQAVMPASVGDEHVEFVGIVSQANVDASKIFKVQRNGELLARVNCATGEAIAIGDSLGKSNGHDYLVKNGSPVAAVAMEAHASPGVKVIKVTTYGKGGGASNTVVPRWG